MASAFQDAARGRHVAVDLRQAASQFSGVWIYLTILGTLLGRDPLDAEVVRGYWIGNDLVDSVNREDFWSELMAVINARAGSYWKHLDRNLQGEVAPTHAFHVLGVYPWTRLLSTGRPEPLDVLTSCCIRPGIVTAVNPGQVHVDAMSFAFRRGMLHAIDEVHLDVPIEFGDELAVGDHVALHWGKVCDVLSPVESNRLRGDLERQLDMVNQRIR